MTEVIFDTSQAARICLAGPWTLQPDPFDAQFNLLCQHLREEGLRVRQVGLDRLAPGQRPTARDLLLSTAALILAWPRLLLAILFSDVVHVQVTGSWSFFLVLVPAFLLARPLRRRVLASYHASGATEFLARWHRLAWPVLRRLDGFTVPSAHLREVFRPFGLEPAILSNIASADGSAMPSRESWPPRILWHQPFLANANPTLALEAFARVRQHVPEARLLMVGRGPLVAELRDQAVKLGIADGISYRSQVPTPRLGEVVAAAGILWNTAIHDDIVPAMILEAATRGTAIVSTAQGAIPEMLDNGVDAILVPLGDAEALAAASAQILRRPVLAEGLTGNARLALARYTWPGVRQAVARLYGLHPEGPTSAGATDQETVDGDLSLDRGEVSRRAEFLWSDRGVDGPDRKP